MSFVGEKPQTSAGDTFAGGEASLPQIFGAAMRQMWYVENFNAREAALDEAIRRRNDEVFAVTGRKPSHPLLAVSEGPGFISRHSRAERLARWQREVDEATRGIPDTMVADRLNRSIEGDALAIAREAEGDFGRLAGSRGGLGSFLASFGGAMAGGTRDPIVLGSFFFGGGIGGGRTLLTRMVATALGEGAANAALTAAAQPAVQAWRAEAGLPAGAEEAARNVAFAGVMGAAFGAGGRALAEGLARLAPREALPAAARGAVDHAETLDHLDATRPAAANAERHDVATATAQKAGIAAATDPDTSFRGFEPDADTVSRIADEIVGPAPEPATQPVSLVRFLLDHGGVRDDGGELSHLGADELFRDRSRSAGRGRRAVADRRMPLDMAREAAEEAGYIGRAGEMQVASVSDLLEAIDAELRGRPVFARADMDRLAPQRDHEAMRAAAESAVDEVARIGGPAISSHYLRAAAEMMLREHMDAGDALERVLTRAELDGDPPLAIELPAGLDDVLTAGDIKAAKTAAGAFARERFAGTSVTNHHDGSTIQIGAQGIKHTISRKPTRAALAALTRLDDMLAWARPTGSAPDRLGRPNVKAVHFYERDLRYGGGPARMRIVVRETNEGRLYYDHSEIRKGGPGDGPSLQDDGPGDGPGAPGTPRDNIGPGGGDDNLPPGWSDEELLAASDGRGNPPNAEADGVDRAGEVPDGMLLAEADAAQLRAAGMGDLVDDISRDEGLAALVEACKAT